MGMDGTSHYVSSVCVCVQVFKVAAEDYQTYALKEVYLKHVDPAIISAYTNEIRLLNKLQGKPEIITLHN